MRTELYPGETPGIEHYIFALRRRWPVLIVCIVLGALLGNLYVGARAHSFGASTKVLVGHSPVDAAATPDLRAEADVVMSTAVARAALTDVGGTDVDAALDAITVVFPSESSVLDIVARASDPFRARDLSAAFAEAYIAQRTDAARRNHEVAVTTLTKERDALWAQSDADDLARPGLAASAAALAPDAANAAELVRLQQALSDLDTRRTLRTQRLAQITNDLSDLDRRSANEPVPAQVLRAATVPSKALGAPNAAYFAGFVVGGALLGVVVCFVLWRRDGSASGTQRVVDAVGVPLLGAVATNKPHLLASPGGAVAASASSRMAPATYESYLRACRLLTRSLDKSDRHTLMVASATSAREKSLVATNLAMAFARLGKSTVLVCADLVGAGPEQLLQPVPGPGLSELLVDGVALDVQPYAGVANLYVLGAGERPGEARDRLDSAAMRTVVEQLATKFDLVVVDSSPTLHTVDAVAVGAMVGSAVLVAGHRRRALRAAARARDELERGGCAVLGVVVDRVAR